MCGVRLKTLDEAKSIASVRHRWINQNPFKSMYFAVQMMAAELSTGALLLSQIRQSGKNISMLVASNRAVYHKKATGRVTFTCEGGWSVAEAIAKCTASTNGQTINLTSIGRNEAGEVVSEMVFEWTLKLR